ncbi:glycosyltransferase family 4 protein [Methanorbis rubei]|uniref:Alpha-galactosylglucosyldiacylglycerol synthase n=1 Tax=Methanorbis rubei TaxID=3028300 RepID=A0AAE4MEK9_9EURY|nr:Alpha-galactosylglucosyldiacylglycerol synthase [Methanocorpusculaceae archaeon Cs1]
MKVNIYVEDYWVFKYIGCSTLARMLYQGIAAVPGVEAYYNSSSPSMDVTHYHSFGPGVHLNRMRNKGISILTAHSTPRLNTGNVAGASYINRLYPPIYRKFDHIVTITPPSTREVQDMLPDMPITMIPNGVDLTSFAPSDQKRREFREFLGISDDRPVVLTVAQQTPRKGIYDFLTIADTMPEYTFVWVGGYPYGLLSSDRKMIEERKAKAGSNVIFTGFVPDITAVYCGADLLFMPSYGEIMSIVALEGLASGLPVISRDLPEFREVFSGICGFFSNNEEAEFLIRDEELWRRSATTSRASVEQFDIHRIAKMHVDLYERLLA